MAARLKRWFEYAPTGEWFALSLVPVHASACVGSVSDHRAADGTTKYPEPLARSWHYLDQGDVNRLRSSLLLTGTRAKDCEGQGVEPGANALNRRFVFAPPSAVNRQPLPT